MMVLMLVQQKREREASPDGEASRNRSASVP
jgi:hypothetical protein